MSYFGSNIRKIRSIQKISQTEFAEVFDLSRASIGSYEEGRAEPKIDLINRIAKYFSITIDELINKELTVNELYHFDVGNEPTFKSTKKFVCHIKNIPFYSSIHEVERGVIDDNKELDIIKIPLHETSMTLVAVNVMLRDYRALPNSIKQNDIVIIETQQNNISRDQYYVLKIGDAIFISKLKVLADHTILVLQVDYDLLRVSIDDIDYYYPIVRSIGNLVDETESKRIGRLEEQFYQLVEKTV
ncbi:helix-turn-helix transcriptional regulator [Carboxylicivirga sp. M1479]|uniref:helix-turn-helix domain-containing protein n=1 Tax=Carboxylicivirga sp. M1479 TaxID=2594476 RepID=UPI00117845CC|nr:helix-turn-helix transcriptional regulator [Carboxylicivirga sp. M1479]TRX71201.1 helix-turn-helix transcriptional regulator [Carboxylicivirga sp. M1479]